MVGRKFVVLLIKVRFLVFPQLKKKEGSLAELVDCDGLENHWARNCPVGSNPTASAKKMKKTFGKYKQKLYNKSVKSSLKRLTNIE